VPHRPSTPPPPILPVGTQIVSLVAVRNVEGLIAHPRGAVGVVLPAPSDATHAYRVQVSVRAVYDKPRKTETQVAQALVRHSAAKAAAIVKPLGLDSMPLLPKLKVKILDGNHAGTCAGRA
jgi:hypothetical protein